jgi:hypothetical protein
MKTYRTVDLQEEGWAALLHTLLHLQTLYILYYANKHPVVYYTNKHPI